MPRVGLHFDGHILVVRLLALLWGVVVEGARGGVRELLSACFGVGEDNLRHAAFRRKCHLLSSLYLHLCRGRIWRVLMAGRRARRVGVDVTGPPLS